jgi:hypothetical protein
MTNEILTGKTDNQTIFNISATKLVFFNDKKKNITNNKHFSYKSLKNY